MDTALFIAGVVIPPIVFYGILSRRGRTAIADFFHATFDALGEMIGYVSRERRKHRKSLDIVDPRIAWQRERRELRRLEMKAWDDEFHMALPLAPEEHSPQCNGMVEIIDEYVVQGDDIYTLAIQHGHCRQCGWDGVMRESERNYLQRPVHQALKSMASGRLQITPVPTSEELVRARQEAEIRHLRQKMFYTMKGWD